MKKVTVIGSGFTGCMFAMMLKNKDWDVTVIDKASFTGGGVRTFYHGGHPYTYGPRHFIGPEENMPAFEFLNKIVPLNPSASIAILHFVLSVISVAVVF